MSSRSEFRPDIEGLRAVAIILVLLYHAQIPWFPGGFIGVDVFFVISGFLITRTLLSEAQASGAIRLREFYARRVRRLLPASALVLVATGVGVLVALPSSMWRTFGGDIVAAGTYIVNWRFAFRAVDYLAQDIMPSPVQHFWSLSVEEQFYLIWPALIIGGIALGRRTQRPVQGMIGLVLVVVVLAPSLFWSIFSSGREPASAFFATTTRLWELAAGALIAVFGTVAFQKGATRIVVKGTGLLLLIGASVLVDGSVPWPGVAAFAPIVGTGLLIIGGGGSNDVIERGLSTLPMRKVGAWSYSLYLWHWPPLAILAARWGGLTTWQAVLITLASAIPAVAAYKWVETPLRFGRSLQVSPSLTMSVGTTLTLASVVVGLGVALAVPIGAALVSADDSAPLIGARAIVPGSDAETLLAQVRATTTFFPSPAAATSDRPTLYDEGCQQNQTDSQPVVCESGDPEGDRLILVVGDSKVAQWEPALDVIGRNQEWRILTVTKSACELTTATPATADGPYTSCEEWNDEVFDLVGKLNPELILVSQGSATAWNNDTSSSERDVMVEGMLGAYERVTAQGSRLGIVLDNPHPRFVVRDCVAERPDDLASCAFPLDEIEATGGRSVQQEVAELGGYPILDMTDMICPDGICLPIIGGVLVYRDSHLTATYVTSMADVMEERVLALLSDA